MVERGSERPQGYSVTIVFAAILGFHGMLNQVQYHDAFVDKKEKGSGESSFQSEYTINITVVAKLTCNMVMIRHSKMYVLCRHIVWQALLSPRL